MKLYVCFISAIYREFKLRTCCIIRNSFQKANGQQYGRGSGRNTTWFHFPISILMKKPTIGCRYQQGIQPHIYTQHDCSNYTFLTILTTNWAAIKYISYTFIYFQKSSLKLFCFLNYCIMCTLLMYYTLSIQTYYEKPNIVPIPLWVLKDAGGNGEKSTLVWVKHPRPELKLVFIGRLCFSASCVIIPTYSK